MNEACFKRYWWSFFHLKGKPNIIMDQGSHVDLQRIGFWEEKKRRRGEKSQITMRQKEFKRWTQRSLWSHSERRGCSTHTWWNSSHRETVVRSLMSVCLPVTMCVRCEGRCVQRKRSNTRHRQRESAGRRDEEEDLNGAGVCFLN